MKLNIGSRGSRLALWQATWVKSRMEAAGHAVEIKIIKTTGDKLAAASLTPSGAKGLFIKEIEEALASGAVDLAVHSLKDLPVDLTAGLCVAAVARREDPRDVLISRNGRIFSVLAAGARVGTSSLRRQSQLRNLRPDLELMPVRGNVDTRIRKLDSGDCEALVMAAAGIHRLGLQGRISEYFSPDRVCPAAGQGALAIEIRCGDARAEEAAGPLDHPPTRQAVRAERAALGHLGGGCQTPIAAYAQSDGSLIEISGVVASPDGAQMVRARACGGAEDPEAVGASLAQNLLQAGAHLILQCRGGK